MRVLFLLDYLFCEKINEGVKIDQCADVQMISPNISYDQKS